MPDNPGLIESHETKLEKCIEDMHNDGLRPDVVHLLLKTALDKLNQQTVDDNWPSNVTISPQNITGSLE